MHYAFGTWLDRYEGQSVLVHQLKDAFRDAAFKSKCPPARYRNIQSVESLLICDDCLPDWAMPVLIQCEKCWKSDRNDFGFREIKSLLAQDLA